ncbi:MAG TPA: hypothetical protein VMN58_09015 [Acidimicrobiales bacterium]|nr:hypothetical protein [Acidimicrobiales bacterium]
MPPNQLLSRVVTPFVDLVRWGEPWDIEDDPDPLLDQAGPGPSCAPLIPSG